MSEKMELNRYTNVDQEFLTEYVGAIKMVKSIRQVLLLLLMMMLLIPLVVYGGIKWGKLTESDAVTTSMAGEVEVIVESRWNEVARAAMVIGEQFSGFIVALLAFAYLLSVNINLIGRLGGTKDSIAAFFWIVVVMFFMVPWRNVIWGDQPSLVFYDLDTALASEAGLENNWLGYANHYGRYLVTPFLFLWTVIVADIRFGSSYRLAIKKVQEELEISVH